MVQFNASNFTAIRNLREVTDMSKHTPGPWQAKILYPDKNGEHMRRLDAKGEFKEHDARLIAAAPDLLAALEEIKKQIGVWYPGTVPAELIEAVHGANKAIAKAKGE